MRANVLCCPAQVLRRVDGEPQTFVPECMQQSLGGQLRKGRRLVVALHGEPLDGGLAEDVDAAADPVRHLPRLGEAGYAIILQLDHAEGRWWACDCDRRRGAGL